MQMSAYVLCCTSSLAILASAQTELTGLREATWTEFEAASQTWPKPKGTILAHYEAVTDDGGVGRFTLGYDSQTGAWFDASHHFVRGVDVDGLQIEGPPRRESVRVAETQHPNDWPVVPNCAGTHLPLLIRRPEQVDWVRRDEDGSWYVGFRFARFGHSDRQESTLVFSADGVPLEWHIMVPAGDSLRPTVISYSTDDRSPTGFFVAAENTPYRLVSVEYFPQSRPDLFELKSIESIAIDNRIFVDAKSESVFRESNPTFDGATPAPYAQNNAASRAALPLMITGVVVVAIGLFALIRMRMAR